MKRRYSGIVLTASSVLMLAIVAGVVAFSGSASGVAGTTVQAGSGQLAPGDWIEFAPCSLDDADQALRDIEAGAAPGEA